MSGSGNDEVRLDDTLAKALEQMACDLESHGAIDLDAYRVIYPRHAARIAELVPTLRALHVAMATDGEKPGDAEASLPWGVLGDFRLVREIGRGGMGIVYEAEQISLRRRVALKVLPWAGMWDDRHLQRFKNEAAAAAQLDHPHIVQVYGVASERGVNFFAMRFVDGMTIADVIRAQLDAKPRNAQPKRIAREDDESPDSGLADRSMADAGTTPAHAAALSTVVSHSARRRFQRIAELGLQAAEALAHAHQAGIIHRDIKPSNLLLDKDGKLWVTDFGLAKMDDSATLTTMGCAPGTLRYMSPEQLVGSPFLDGRSDVYSLGVTLYEMLAGQPAFQGSERPGVTAAIRAGRFAPIHQLDAATPRDLETIILKAMACDADDRFASAGAMADDLRRFVEGRPIRSRRAGLLERAVKLSRRHARITALALAAMSLLTAACVIASIQIWQTRNQADAARDLAERRLAEATRQRKIADALRMESDSQRYAEDVRFACSLYKEGHFELARQALSRSTAFVGDVVASRFELSFLRSRLQQDLPRQQVNAQLFEASYSKKLNTVATVSNDGLIRLWQLPQLECIAELRDHDGDVNSTAFVDGDRLLVSAGDDGILRTWNVETRKLISRDDMRLGELEVAAFDDALVIGFGRNGACFVWDVVHHETVCQMATPTGRHLGSTVDPVSKSYVIVHDDQTATRVRPFHGQEVRAHLTSGMKITCADYSPDGRFLATVGGDDMLRVFDAETMEILDEKRMTASVAQFLKWSPDGETIVVMSRHGAWAYYHWNDGARDLTDVLSSPETELDCELRGTFVSNDQAIVLDHTGAIQYLPRVPFKLVHFPALAGERVRTFDLAVTGDAFGVGGETGTVQLWDIKSRQMRWEHKSTGTIAALRLDLAGRVAAVINAVGTENSEVRRWNASTGQEMSRFATEMVNWQFAPHGDSALAYNLDDGRPLAVELTVGGQICTGQGIGSVPPTCFTPSGDHYVTPPDKIYLVNTKTLEVTEIVENHAGNHWIALAATDNARVVLIKRYGGFAAFRRDGQRWTFFNTPGENVDAAAISHDESRCATLTSEGTVTLWELDSGRELLRFNLPRPSQPGQIRFCNDGRRLMCAFTTGVARGITIACWDTGVK